MTAPSELTLDSPKKLQIFEAFNRYPWETDNVFQQGLESILNQLSKVEQSDDEKDMALYQDLQLLKAKHFYFTRFQQDFDLEEYLKYEAEKADLKKKQAFESNDDQQEKLFDRIEQYDYDNDAEYTEGMPNIIRGWLAQQSETGLWDKEKLDAEFAKTKAFFYNARVEKVDLLAYFKWRAKLEQANAPSCPFANLWQNKLSAGFTSQINGATFIMEKKPKNQSYGPTLITLASPQSKNIFSYERLEELATAVRQAENDARTTSILINANVADEGMTDPFSSERIIETKDTKTWSSGLAYEETSKLVAGSDLRQVSLHKLASQYYDSVRSLLNPIQPQLQSNSCDSTDEQQSDLKPNEDKAPGSTPSKKLIISFSNGEVPLNATYLTLGPQMMRVITEFTLLNFSLQISHAPVPPLLLLAMARARAMALAATQPSDTKKTYVAGLELYLALAAPAYGKLRGPELLRLGLADAFVPEAKLMDAIDTTTKLAICPVEGDKDNTTSAAIQLALAIFNAYPGPDRLQVWEDQIESTFGKAESLQDLKLRLEKLDNVWSQNILAHWKTLPPVLLNMVYMAVKKTTALNPLEIIELEQTLNAKWRQTQDYKSWLIHKMQPDESSPPPTWISNPEEVDATVESCLNEPLVLPDTTDEPVIYVAPHEPTDDAKRPPGVCPVTGQVSESMAVCPVFGQTDKNAKPETNVVAAGVCPVTGQVSEGVAVCPVTGQKADITTESNVTAGVCPATSLTKEL